MIKEIRKTVTGTEYWDSEQKKILFVPNEEEPDFEVSSDESKDSDNQERTDADDSKEGIKDLDSFGFNEMNIPQLKAYAEDNGIEIPSGTTKRADIIKLLS